MSFLGWLGYGQTDASSTPPPSGPELTPGWEVYKNQLGEILYGNKRIQSCQFNAPVVQAQEQHIPVAPVQARSARSGIYTTPSGGLSATPYGYVPMSMADPFAGRGGLKRRKSRRMQSRRKQTKRKQSKRKQSKRIS
jgi:hypothetical protein